jgi:wobble nucleotide-excising tRNase
LGRDEISIEVTSETSGERFRLMRSEKVARNLSEGEKTAISFSFFLTKLLEFPTLEEIIIYIDDPISSLDSNHVFQINSILKNFFFYQDGGVGHCCLIVLNQRQLPVT